jgi:hypothetical protein
VKAWFIVQFSLARNSAGIAIHWLFFAAWLTKAPFICFLTEWLW